MKTRIVLGMGLLATLLLVPVIVEAQPSSGVDRVRQLSEQLEGLRNEYRLLDGQRANSIREIAAREKALKAELIQLAQKRAEVEQSLERHRQELQAKVDETSAEIHALTKAPTKVVRPSSGLPRKPSVKGGGDSLEEKVNQILKRLEVMEQRLNRLDWKVNPPPK